MRKSLIAALALSTVITLLAIYCGDISLADQKVDWSADYSFTLHGSCLPGGQLNVQVPGAKHIVTTRRLTILGWHLAVGRFYSIAGKASANGQSFDFAESDHRPSQGISPAHLTSRVLSGPGQVFKQDFRFDGNQEVPIGQATCS